MHAVRGLDFEVAPRCVGLLEPNGAGKTTTMRMIMGLTTPSAGELRVFGVPVAEPAVVQARIGLVPQENNLDPDLSVRQNLEVYGAISACRPRRSRCASRRCSISCSWVSGSRAASISSPAA